MSRLLLVASLALVGCGGPARPVDSLRIADHAFDSLTDSARRSLLQSALDDLALRAASAADPADGLAEVDLTRATGGKAARTATAGRVFAAIESGLRARSRERPEGTPESAALRALTDLRAEMARSPDTPPDAGKLRQALADLRPLMGAGPMVRLQQDLSFRAFLDGHPKAALALLPKHGEPSHAAVLLRDLSDAAQGDAPRADGPTAQAVAAGRPVIGLRRMLPDAPDAAPAGPAANPLADIEAKEAEWRAAAESVLVRKETSDPGYIPRVRAGLGRDLSPAEEAVARQAKREGLPDAAALERVRGLWGPRAW